MINQAIINGISYNVYFTLPSIKYLFSRISENSIERLQTGKVDTEDIATVAHFIYAGLLGGFEIKGDNPTGQTLDIPFNEVYSQVEQAILSGQGYEVLNITTQTFAESNIVKWIATQAEAAQIKPVNESANEEIATNQ